ncbi:MAG: PAS domain S-box protein, partial [Microthrixaceae bacterium]|nr:PAS domain S-box protein [Microthrixaceae bacterium]
MDQIPAFTRSLLHHPSAVVLAIDQTATIRWISQSVRTFLGYSPDWLIGRVALDLVHPDEVEDLAIGLTIIADRELALADRSTRIVDADGGEVEVRLQPIGMVPGDDGQLLVIWLRRVDLERQLLDTFRLLAEGTGWDEVVGAVLGAARESDDVRLSFHRWNGPERDRTVVAAGEEHWGGDLARRWAEVCGDPDSARLRRLEQPEWCTVDELAERSAPLAGWAKESGRELAHLSPVLVGGDDSFGLLVSWYRGEVSDAQRHLFSRHDGLRAAALRTAAQRDRGVAVLEAAARTDPLTGLVNR